MLYKTLENSSIGTITAAFNAAFADYTFNMQQTEESLSNKIFREHINLSKSIGVFDDDILAGFILFGIGEHNDITTAWDGGTGVLPAYRRQQLTLKMFEHIKPLLKNAGCQQILLEVLTTNTAALSIYQKIGFEINRELHGYKGYVNTTTEQHYIEALNTFDADELLSMGEWTPCWQYNNHSILNMGHDVLTIGIRDNNRIVAYTHYNTANKRILQFAVDKHHRRKGMATAMFQYISSQSTEPIMAINIDGDSENSNQFLKSIGLERFVSQYEMVIKIS